MKTGMGASISLRNASRCIWELAQESAILSDFFSTRVYSTTSGERQAYLSTKSMLILAPNQGPSYYRRFYPKSGQRLVDATLDAEDQVYLLTRDLWLYRCRTVGPNRESDWPDSGIDLSDFMNVSFDHITLSEALGGCRVIACWGSAGGLLIQVDEETFTVTSTLRIDTDSGMLAGSQDLVFLRMANVVSLKSGQILLGTLLSNGLTTELMIDLATRCPSSVWTPEAKLSPAVTTGEILEAREGIGARPDPPTWLPVGEPSATTRLISWDQRRPDLVAGYEVWCGVDAVPPSLYALIPTGAIRHVTLKVEDGHAYHLTVRAQGSSAVSAFSSELPITVGVPPSHPQLPQ